MAAQHLLLLEPLLTCAPNKCPYIHVQSHSMPDDGAEMDKYCFAGLVLVEACFLASSTASVGIQVAGTHVATTWAV